MQRSADCPFSSANSDSKSAATVGRRLKALDGVEYVRDYPSARGILLDKGLLQAGAGAEFVDLSDPDMTPVFYLDGAVHRRKRANIARFFTNKAIAERYQAIIERETTRLLGQLRRDGTARLDIISFELTVAVAANIVGLTNSDIPKMARRLARILAAASFERPPLPARLRQGLGRAVSALGFYTRDVIPALRARRRAPQDDLLSELVAKKASLRSIMIECMTYAGAGMVTTREFIVMAAWHLFDDAALRADFLAGDEERQLAILYEILRIEPIASVLMRREGGSGGDAKTYGLDIRAVNSDEAVVGACPFKIDPERGARTKANGAFLSFGAGAHHCPGKQVALHETRLFLDALLRVPGIRLARAPDVGWSDALLSYELRDAVVTCDRA
ncbi:MAG: cytochrome P450 [Nannocystaceae bacterium]